MDDIDRASITEERERQAALDRHAAQMAAESHEFATRDGQRICIDCEYPIPAGRIAAMPYARRCVSCEEDHQRRIA